MVNIAAQQNAAANAARIAKAQGKPVAAPVSTRVVVPPKPRVITVNKGQVYSNGKLVANSGTGVGKKAEQDAKKTAAGYLTNKRNILGNKDGSTYRSIYGVQRPVLSPTTGSKEKKPLANELIPGNFQTPQPAPQPVPNPTAPQADYTPDQGGYVADPNGYDYGTTANRPVLDKTISAYGSFGQPSFQEPAQPRSLQDIRQEQLARYQSVIDATQGIYNSDVARINQAGAAEKARAGSMAVGAGLAGSPFQSTIEASVQQNTDQQLQEQSAKRQADVSNLLLEAEKSSDSLYQQGLDEYQQNRDFAYNAFNNERDFYVNERDKAMAQAQAKAKAAKDSAINSLGTIAKSGYSIDEIPKDQYQELLAKSGMSDFEARATWAAQTPAANATYTTQNGFMVGTYFDPHTGKPVVTTTPLPPELAGGSTPDLQNIKLADGSVVFYDANNPYNVDGSLRTISYAGQGIKDPGEEDKLLSPTEAAALGVPYGTKQSEAFGVQTTINGLTKEQRSQLNTIQDNARQDENIKTFPAVRASYETARSAAANENHGVGDLVLLRMLAKITDPTTGVQSAEFQTFEGAQGALQKVGLTLTKKMWSGGRLTDEARQAFAAQAEEIYKQRESAYQSSIDFYDEQATGYGIPKGMVQPVYIAPNEGGPTAADGIQFNKSYSSPSAVIKDYPELQSGVDALKSQGFSDSDILQILESEHGSQSFNNVGADTNQGAVQKLSMAFQPGSKGGQCGHFVNQHTGLKMGDSIESKLAKVDPSIGKPNNPVKPGDVFVSRYSWTGHTGFIKRVIPKADGSFDYEVIDSNYGLDEKVKTHIMPGSKMAGFARVPLTV